MNKIKITHLCTDSKIGGTETMLLTLLKYSDKSIYQHTVISLLDRGPLLERAQNFGASTFSVKMKNKLDLLALFKLHRYLKNNPPNILQSYLFHSNIIGRILRKALKIPIMISGQRNVDDWRKWYHILADRITYRWTNLIISNSIAGKNRLISKEKIPKNKIIVIPNGIDNPPLNQRKFEKIEKIGVLASLTPKKGHQYLIHAFKKLAQANPNLKLHIAGAGPLKKNLENLCNQLKIGKSVIFDGFITNKWDWYPKIDLFILPSLWEGMPVCLLEAMSCELPIVATNVGGVSEIIENEINGLLIPPKDSDRIVKACQKFIDSPEYAQKTGKQNRENVNLLYSAEKMTQEYQNNYQSLYTN